MSLTHRERVQAVLAGEKPDKPVVDLGGRVASMSPPAYLALKEQMGFGQKLTSETITFFAAIGEFDPRVLDYFDIPIRRVYLKPASTFQLEIAEDGSFEDEWHTTRKPVGHFNARIGYPLQEATADDLGRFPWPDPNDSGRVEGLAKEARRWYEETGFSLAAGHISAGIFQDCWNLRGMEQFFIDMALDREFAEALLDHVLEIHLGMWAQFLDAVGEYVDIVETADDLGGQVGLLISPEMYRVLVKPRHARLNEFIRRRTQAKILFHTCGAVMPLVDDLIEIGVEILNPIQPLPGLMEPEMLKKRYGDRLLFHGGLDVQSLLLSGTPTQVRQHVLRYQEVLGTDRYIMAPANTVQPGTPPENIIAAYQAALDHPPR
jgi:uroporphyrinogen decarboxylase